MSFSSATPPMQYQVVHPRIIATRYAAGLPRPRSSTCDDPDHGFAFLRREPRIHHLLEFVLSQLESQPARSVSSRVKHAAGAVH
jgi:hypothetical protein